MALPNQKTILILGGGVGGVVIANELRKKIDSVHRVVLIDQEPQHLFQPSLLWLMTGDREPEKISRDLARLQRKGIEVITGEITQINVEAKSIVVGEQTLEADYLVVSLGAQLAPEKISGLASAGHNLYSLEGATSIRDERSKFTTGKLVVLVSSMPFKCPAAPYEAVMLLEADLRKRKVREQVEVSIYSPEPGPMGVAGADVSAGVRQMVESKDIAYHPQRQVSEVDPERKVLRFNDDTEAPFDFLAYVPPHVAPTVVLEAGLTNESGWIPVDRDSLETSSPDIFAIGDVTTIPLEIGLPLPKAGTFASTQGKAVAKTIAARINGSNKVGNFDGFGECVVEIGNGKAGFGRGNFYASPSPSIKLRGPSRLWHWAKIWFEWRWLRRWF